MKRNITIAAILLIALSWRLLGIRTTEVWSDEATQLLYTHGNWSELLTGLPVVEATPPLGFLLFKAWSSLGQSEIWMRLMPVLLGVATVAMIMISTSRLYPQAWWTSGLLAALSPQLVHYSQEIRVYSFLVLLVVVAFWIVGNLIRTGSNRWLVALTLTTALAAHCHSVGAFVFPMLGVYLLFRHGWHTALVLLRPAGVWLWLALMSPMIWFNVHWSSLYHDDWWVAPIDLNRAALIGKAFSGVLPFEEWEAGDFLSRMWPGYFLERLLWGIPALLLILGLIDQRTNRSVLALMAASASYILMLWLAGKVAMPCLLERTLLPALVPLLMATAIGATGGLPKVSGAASVLLVLLYAVGWTWLVYCGPPRRDTNLAAFEYIRQRLGPHDVVFPVPAWFEDLAAYRLRGQVESERLLSTGNLVYKGFPLTRQMVAHVPDVDWRDRIRAALSRLEHNCGKDYSVWLVRFGWPIQPTPDTPEALLNQRHHVAESFVAPSPRAASVLRYLPN